MNPQPSALNHANPKPRAGEASLLRGNFEVVALVSPVVARAHVDILF